MSRTRQVLGPPLPNAAQHFFFSSSKANSRLIPLLVVFRQAPSSFTALPKTRFPTEFRSVGKKGGELTQRAVRFLCVCPCVRASVRARGGKYEQSRPKRALRVLLSTFHFPPPDNNRCSFGRLRCRSAGGRDTAFCGDPRSRWRRNQLLLKTSERRWSRSGFARCTWFALLRVQNWWHLQEEVMHFYFVHCRVLPYCWMLVTSLATRGVSLMIHRLKLRRLVFYFSA